MLETTTIPGASRPHYPALDGLRGAAVLMVICCHLFPYHLVNTQGGWLKPFALLAAMGTSGVDLFFVLSGFLITGILYRGRSERGYFTNFYARRVLRVFPLYYLLLVTCLVILPHINWFAAHNLSPGDGNSWPYWFYLANFDKALHVRGYEFLRVVWSLAIEEQYYAVWPFLVWVCSRAKLEKILAYMYAGSILLRAGLCLFAGYPAWVLYRMTWTRLDGIALGGLIAMKLADRADMSPGLHRFSRLAPYLLVLALGIWVGGMMPRPGVWSAIRYWPMVTVGWTVTTVAYGATLVAALRPGWIQRFLETRFLRKWGKYSYAAYLLHLPVAMLVGWLFKLAPAHECSASEEWLIVLVKVAAIYPVARLSWWLIESPILSLKKYFVDTPKASLPQLRSGPIATATEPGGAPADVPSFS